MKKLIFLSILVIYNLPIFSQKSCFEYCWETREHLAADQNGSDIFLLNKSVLDSLVGCPIPEFEVTTLDGKNINSLDLQGKVVVLNFWFIYCAPCVAEMPGLNKLVKKFKDKDVVFIAFGRDNAIDVSEFLEEHSFDYQQVVNAENWSLPFCAMAGFPMNMVIDKDGNLAYVSTGGNTDEPMEKFHELKPEIEKCLEKN